jgi:hypothetical protein
MYFVCTYENRTINPVDIVLRAEGWGKSESDEGECI